MWVMVANVSVLSLEQVALIIALFPGYIKITLNDREMVQVSRVRLSKACLSGKGQQESRKR